MKLVRLKFRPGINREQTDYSNEGGWWDCNRVRFRGESPESIGGWQKFSDAQFLGYARSMHPFVTLSSDIYIGIGTNLKYYIQSGGQYNDITPIRETTAAGDVTFSASNGSSTLTVSDTSHGAMLGDYVTFSGAVSLGGQVVADELNKEFSITSITDANTYTVELSVTADGSDTGNGGASVVGVYQVNVGSNNTVGGNGWGADPWGDGGWSDAGTSIAGSYNLRIWSHDNFGEDLIINPRGGDIYYWDSSVGLSTRAVSLTDKSGAASAPTVANRIIVSDQDRHVIAFGCDDEFTPGVQDLLLIRFSDQENALDWATSTTNTAGSLRISSGTEIITAVQTKREILVFTDASLHSMQFLGPPFIFGITEIANSIDIVSQQAAVAVNDSVYWMSQGKFMVYNGSVSEIDCSVKEYVFTNINPDRVQAVAAGHNSSFSEVWWFYASLNSDENDRYVVYNYQYNLWYYGALGRTAWIAEGVFANPIAASPDGYLYGHEIGASDGSSNPAVAINSYVESSYTDLEDGDSFFFATKFIPDITFRNSSAGMPAATVTVKARDFPGSAIGDTDTGTVTRSATLPVEQHTNQLFMRLRGRSFAVRIESTEVDTAWRSGVQRINVRTDGRR